MIAERKLLREGGVIVAEHRKEESLPDEFFGFKKLKQRKYGIIMLSIYC
jgi:16S rRNA G966 N2-methylase RsmD|nr:MAG TPA: N6-adenine-specific methylase [Caudoviricetes sp.]